MKCSHDSYWLKTYSTNIYQAGCAFCGKTVCFEVEKNESIKNKAEYELRRKRYAFSSFPLKFLSRCLKRDEHEDGFI